jgi:hypothetical protein
MHSEIEAVRREYDLLATTYDRRWRAYVEATLHAVVEGVGFTGHERILDIAWGTWELERLLLARWPAELPSRLEHSVHFPQGLSDLLDAAQRNVLTTQSKVPSSKGSRSPPSSRRSTSMPACLIRLRALRYIPTFGSTVVTLWTCRG